MGCTLFLFYVQIEKTEMTKTSKVKFGTETFFSEETPEVWIHKYKYDAEPAFINQITSQNENTWKNRNVSDVSILNCSFLKASSTFTSLSCSKAISGLLGNTGAFCPHYPLSSKPIKAPINRPQLPRFSQFPKGLWSWSVLKLSWAAVAFSEIVLSVV